MTEENVVPLRDEPTPLQIEVAARKLFNRTARLASPRWPDLPEDRKQRWREIALAFIRKTGRLP